MATIRQACIPEWAREVGELSSGQTLEDTCEDPNDYCPEDWMKKSHRRLASARRLLKELHRVKRM